MHHAIAEADDRRATRRRSPCGRRGLVASARRVRWRRAASLPQPSTSPPQVHAALAQRTQILALWKLAGGEFPLPLPAERRAAPTPRRLCHLAPERIEPSNPGLIAFIALRIGLIDRQYPDLPPRRRSDHHTAQMPPHCRRRRRDVRQHRIGTRVVRATPEIDMEQDVHALGLAHRSAIVRVHGAVAWRDSQSAGRVRGNP